MWLISIKGKRFLVSKEHINEFMLVSHDDDTVTVHEHIPIWQPDTKEKNGRKKK